MFDPPQTLEEAKAYRYGIWAGEPKGRSYIPDRCAYEIYDNYLFYQCARKNGYGINNLYCKQHAKKVGK